MGKSPFIAGFLGLVPGLGHIYIGNWKGGIFIHIGAWGFLMTGLGIFIAPIYTLIFLIHAAVSATKMND